MTEDPISRRELEAILNGIKEQLAAQKESVTIAMTAADRAVTKAETAVEKRFENSNEWRTTVETLQRTYMPRTEFDQANKTLSEKLEDLAKRANARDDRGRGGNDLWAIIIAVIAAITSIATVILIAKR